MQNENVPGSISQLQDESTKIVIELEKHIQVPAITNINNDCVHVTSPVADDGEDNHNV